MELKRISDFNNKTKTLKTLIGTDSIKKIGELQKGDVILYNNQLYKCKNLGEYIIPDEQNFKKVGLRFLSNEYKEKVEDSIDGLYKKMYSDFEVGDKQKIEWITNNRFNEYYFFTPKDMRAIELYNDNISRRSLHSFMEKLKKYAKVEDIEQIIDFPFMLEYTVITKENYEENKFYSFLIEDLAKLKIKKEVFNKAILSEYETIQKYIKKPIREVSENFIYFTYEKKQVHNYYINKAFGNFENNKNFCVEFRKNDDFAYGIYKENTPLDFGFKFDDVDVTLEFESLDRYVETRQNDYETITTYKLTLKFEDSKIEAGKTLDFFVKDMWLPFFYDMIANDTTNKSARELNEKYNKYGVYFKFNENFEGNYAIKFNLVFTDKNQHEEWGSCGQWGKRYAYHLNEKNVRNKSCSYCTWQEKKIEATFLFTIEDKEMKNKRLIFSERTNDTERFEQEFLNTGITFENNLLCLKVFYAIWSVDDAGEWNGWQFAHIIPPFELEFKGE